MKYLSHLHRWGRHRATVQFWLLEWAVGVYVGFPIWMSSSFDLLTVANHSGVAGADVAVALVVVVAFVVVAAAAASRHSECCLIFHAFRHSLAIHLSPSSLQEHCYLHGKPHDEIRYWTSTEADAENNLE